MWEEQSGRHTQASALRAAGGVLPRPIKNCADQTGPIATMKPLEQNQNSQAQVKSLQCGLYFQPKDNHQSLRTPGCGESHSENVPLGTAILVLL